MKTLRQDIKSPLSEVERVWLRKPATIFLFPLLFVLNVIPAVMGGIVDGILWTWRGFFIKCWKGDK